MPAIDEVVHLLCSSLNTSTTSSTAIVAARMISGASACQSKAGRVNPEDRAQGGEQRTSSRSRRLARLFTTLGSVMWKSRFGKKPSTMIRTTIGTQAM